MNNGVDENPPLRERFAEIFARLPEQDIEQFYARYQLWLLRRRVPVLQKQIEAIDEHLAENQRVIHSLQPSAVALAVLARLQASGVGSVELLDQLLERGEDWLDRMMQRLDYCEQVQDFIQGDYTQWCYRSLDGAYDWIDTLLGSVNGDQEPRPLLEENTEATEELLLRRLRQDDEEEPLTSTLKRPVVRSADRAEDEVPGSQLQAEEADEAHVTLEQPPELEDWADLDAPDERPAPWYGAGLAPDSSAESASRDETDGWTRVVQEDGAPQAGMDAVEEVEDAATLPEVGEPQESPGDEVPVRLANAGLESEETRATDAVTLEARVPLAQEEAREEQMVGATEVSGMPVDSGVQGERGEDEQVVQPVAESETVSQGTGSSGADPGIVRGEPQDNGGIEALSGAEVGIGRDSADQRSVAEEPGERETLALPEAAGEAPDGAIDPQEEERPWYEYLDLDESGSQERQMLEEYVEPEVRSAGTLDTSIQEGARIGGEGGDEAGAQTGEPGPRDDATEPMKLRDMRPVQEQASSDADGEARNGPPAGILLPGDGAGPDIEPAQEARNAEALSWQRNAQEARGEVHERAPSRLQGEVPKRRGFWRRLFGWLRK